MAKFRTKPVVVDAWQFVGFPPNADNPPPDWIHKAIDTAMRPGAPKAPGSTLALGGIVSRFHEQALDIGTADGELRANAGDWIVRFDEGDLCPCKAEAFAQLYVPVKTRGRPKAAAA